MNSSSWRNVSNVYSKYTDSPPQPGCDSVAGEFNAKLGSSKRSLIFGFDDICRVSEVVSVSAAARIFQPTDYLAPGRPAIGLWSYSSSARQYRTTNARNEN